MRIFQKSQKSLLLRHFYPISNLIALFDSTRWILKVVHRILKLNKYANLCAFLEKSQKLPKIASSSPFLTRFQVCLIYVKALGNSFKTCTQNFDIWLLWPLTLIFDLNCTLATKCYSFTISIPFALCDSSWWGLQNFYTEFCPMTPLTFDLDSWPILYILLKKCYSFTVSNPILISFSLCDSTR